jgi:DNA-directed RNA polymerase specialized sigma24 family protein
LSSWFFSLGQQQPGGRYGLKPAKTPAARLNQSIRMKVDCRIRSSIHALQNLRINARMNCDRVRQNKCQVRRRTLLKFAAKRRQDCEGRTDYATHSDFCAIFRDHPDRLYRLALVLTGNELIAERCLLTAFDLCVERLVFKESASAWSRRSVIKTAIKFLSPAPDNRFHIDLIANRTELDFEKGASLRRMQELTPFDRFVFVMSVLERYSDRDCALLLGCSFSHILPARIRAFQQISRAEKRYPAPGSASPAYVIDADWLECG